MPVKLGEETIGVSTPSVNFARRQPDMRGGAFVVSALDALSRSMQGRESSKAKAADEAKAQSLLKSSVQNFRAQISQLEESGELSESTINRVRSQAEMDLVENLAGVGIAHWDKVRSAFNSAISTQDKRIVSIKPEMFVYTKDTQTGNTEVKIGDLNAFSVSAFENSIAALPPQLRAKFAKDLAETGDFSKAREMNEGIINAAFETEAYKVQADLGEQMLKALGQEAKISYEQDRYILNKEKANQFKILSSAADTYLASVQSGQETGEAASKRYLKEATSHIKSTDLYNKLVTKYGIPQKEAEEMFRSIVQTNADYIRANDKKDVLSDRAESLKFQKEILQSEYWLNAPKRVQQYDTIGEALNNLMMISALSGKDDKENLVELYVNTLAGDKNYYEVEKAVSNIGFLGKDYKYNPNDRSDPSYVAANTTLGVLTNMANGGNVKGLESFTVSPEKAVEMYYMIKNSPYLASMDKAVMEDNQATGGNKKLWSAALDSAFDQLRTKLEGDRRSREIFRKTSAKFEKKNKELAYTKE